MVKAKSGGKKITKKEQHKKRTNAVRAKAHAKLAQISKEEESQTPVIQQPSQSQNVSNRAPFPTENNGNSHDQSYLSAATKLANQPIKE